MTKKFAKESEAIMTKIVMPNDTNAIHNLMGGRLMYWMDIIAAVASQKHCNHYTATASVDNISFRVPILLGNTVTLKAKVTRAFNSSMEVSIEVHIQDIPSGTPEIKSNTAYFTFVALDKNRKPTANVPEIVPETDEEKEQYEGALRRRQMRLILSGRLEPKDASELKSLFIH